MSSKREQIVEKIIARMQLIKVANGYQTDLGANVQDFQTSFDDDDLPALSVCDLIAEHSLVNNQPTATNQTDVLPIQLRIFIKSDTRAAEVRKMIADVWKAIKVDTRWDGLALWTLPKRSGMIIPEDAFAIAGGAVEIDIHIFNNSFGS